MILTRPARRLWRWRRRQLTGRGAGRRASRGRQVLQVWVRGGLCASLASMHRTTPLRGHNHRRAAGPFASHVGRTSTCSKPLDSPVLAPPPAQVRIPLVPTTPPLAVDPRRRPRIPTLVDVRNLDLRVVIIRHRCNLDTPSIRITRNGMIPCRRIRLLLLGTARLWQLCLRVYRRRRFRTRMMRRCRRRRITMKTRQNWGLRPR